MPTSKGNSHGSDRTSNHRHHRHRPTKDSGKPSAVIISRLHEYITDHAVERYQERVKPALTLTEAKKELSNLLTRFGRVCDERPDYIHDIPESVTDHPGRSDNESWVEIGDTGIAALVIQNRVITILCRGGISEIARENRNRIKQSRRRSKRNQRQVESWVGSGSPRWN